MLEDAKKTLFVAVNAKYVHTNIAVRYLSEYCSREGIDCGFSEFTINEPRECVLEKLYMSGCDIYGFSCYIWNREYVLYLCKNLKKLLPDCKIFLGGPEVSFDAEQILKEHEFVDYVFCGEGEKSVLNFLKNTMPDRCVIKPQILESLDELPFPYSDDDLKRTVEGEKLLYYETSRGCPFSCSYCLSSVEKGVRFLPMERVKKEIKKMTDAGALTIKFVDRTFNSNKERAMEIWEYCMSLEGETCFHFEIGADLLDDDCIKLLERAEKNRFQFEIGVQTTNPDTISAVSRTMNLDKLKKNVINLRNKCQIHLHLDLIAGLPFEDYESFRVSFDDVYSLKPHVLQLGFLKLLKGSVLRSRAEEFGIEHNSYPPYEVFSTNWLGFRDVIKLKAIEDVLERYYNSGRFICTIDCLIKFFSSPFEFYEGLSEFWNEKKLIGQGVKRITLYNILYEFLCSRFEEEIVRLVVIEMKKDFDRWHSNGVGTPMWYKKY